jgi:hypothetical protein
MSGLQSFNVTAPFSNSDCLVSTPHKLSQFNPGMTANGNFMTQFGSWQYPHYGMISVDYTSRLRQPAMGEYLHPENFNGGCLSQTCPSTATCPGGANVQPTQETKQMFDYVFSSMDQNTFVVPSAQIPGLVYDMIRSQSCK